MAESPHERRQRREEIVSDLDTILDDMDFNDGCIMLNILYPLWQETRLSYEEIYNEYRIISFRCFWKHFVQSYETDSKGRITKLYLGDSDLVDDEGDENDYSFDLPHIIECLRNLKHITLFNCRSIPKELNNLPLLEGLSFVYCPSALFRNNIILDEIKFDRLKYLDVCDIGFLSPPMLALISTRLPALEILEI